MPRFPYVQNMVGRTGFRRKIIYVPLTYWEIFNIGYSCELEYEKRKSKVNSFGLSE